MKQPKTILVRWEKEPLVSSGVVARAYYMDSDTMRPLYLAEEYTGVLVERLKTSGESTANVRFLNLPNEAQ